MKIELIELISDWLWSTIIGLSFIISWVFSVEHRLSKKVKVKDYYEDKEKNQQILADLTSEIKVITIEVKNIKEIFKSYDKEIKELLDLLKTKNE